MLLLLRRGRREQLLLRLRRQRPNGQLRRLLLRLLDRRPRLLRLLLELGLLQGRRGLLLLRLRWQRPNGRLRRLLLRRLPRRLLHVLPLRLPREVRARVGSRSDFGGSIARQRQFASNDRGSTIRIHRKLGSAFRHCCLTLLCTLLLLATAAGLCRIHAQLIPGLIRMLRLHALVQSRTLRTSDWLVQDHLASHNLQCLAGRVGRGGGVLQSLPNQLVRVSLNPDQAPLKARQVVTGYCRPSGQDFFAAAASILVAHRGHGAGGGRRFNQRELKASLHVLRLVDWCRLAAAVGIAGRRDLEHGKHSGHRSLATVSPGVSQV
jgi:hypothetical protein